MKGIAGLTPAKSRRRAENELLTMTLKGISKKKITLKDHLSYCIGKLGFETLNTIIVIKKSKAVIAEVIDDKMAIKQRAISKKNELEERIIVRLRLKHMKDSEGANESGPQEERNGA